MSRKFFIGVLILAGLFCVIKMSFAGYEKTKSVASDQAAAPEAAQDTDPKMEAWKKASSPGEHHKALEIFTGNWNYSMRWWQSPEAQPEESKGSNKGEWILGGRFVEQEVKGVAMGQPFEGLSITGYDNVKEEYNTVWLDNMSTGIMTSSSQYDAASKTFLEKGSFSCPMTGEKSRSFRGVIKIVDNDNYTYEMYGNDEAGKEFKVMEITYARAK